MTSPQTTSQTPGKSMPLMRKIHLTVSRGSGPSLPLNSRDQDRRLIQMSKSLGLENILEHQQERDTCPQISVIPNYVADSLSESSDSIYKTPPTMRYSEKVTLTAYNPRNQLLTRRVPVKLHDDAASGHPMSLYSMSSASSLLPEGAQSQDYHASIQTVLSK